MRTQRSASTGQTVKFTLFGDSEFDYTVTAPDTVTATTNYDFMGSLKDEDQENHDVGGTITLMVQAAAPTQGPSATRSFSPTMVEAGGEVVVTIRVANYGRFGRVMETLPDGFAYVSSTLEDAAVSVVGQTVKFTLFGDSEFDYTVTAPDTVTATTNYDFMGSLRDEDQENHDVGGTITLMVQAAAPTQGPSATRSFSPTMVEAGGEVVVTIRVANYGRFGRVMETLPDGFAYVSSTLEDAAVSVVGQTVKFTLFGDSEFDYTVTAPDTVTATTNYDFMGSLRDEDQENHDVGGSTVIRVGSPPIDVTDDPCVETLLVDVPVIGAWSSSCESTARGSYARYYRFTLTEGSTVTITLESTSADPYLYLRAGEAKSGTAAYENDDIAAGTDTNSEIEATLGAGTYTIEATTYGAGEMGSFTLTLSGLGGGTGTMPGPSDDPCLDALSVDVPVSGEWSSDCESTARGSYARYYRFTLTEGSTVTITLESTSADPYLYLRAGEAKSGTAAYENDDIAAGTDTNSEIEATLGAGTYTIEATTYGAGEMGSFTLTLSGLGGGTGTMPGPSDDPCLDALSVDVPVSGEWSSDCESTARGSYARYYRFTLTEGSTVTITLESTSADPYLYLRAGEAKSGTAAYENDDVVPGTDTNSEIEATLGAGTYTIEATTYGAGEMGSFTLTLSGLGGGTGTMPGPSDDPCLDALSVDVPVSGEWSSDCESTARGSYARYYRFTLDEESTVIITLKSSIDPYLYLRAGAAKSGTAVHENDDVVPGTDTNSEIEATLGAGTYTIEATTYGAGEMGSFTLTVSGL